MSDWIDISLPISSESVRWPGAPKTEFTSRRSMARGDRSNNSNLFMNCHTGTHVDAPLHFFQDGKSVDQILLDKMIGEAFVLDFSAEAGIEIETLKKYWPAKGIKKVLLKTKNSRQIREKEFVKDFCALTEEPVRWLLEQGIQLVGIDGPSIQRLGDDPVVHQLLLKAEVVIIEGLDLSRVGAGKYELVCLPLKLVGLEGAPARVILKDAIGD